jgi:hypothetical protein
MVALPVFTFGPLRLDPADASFRRGTKRIPLTPRTLPCSTSWSLTPTETCSWSENASIFARCSRRAVLP